MKESVRLAALGLLFCVSTLAWLVLAGVMTARTSDGKAGLRGAVATLWGQELVQQAPSANLVWMEPALVEEAVRGPNGSTPLDAEGQPLMRKVQRDVQRSTSLPVASTQVDVDLHLDPRRKGLLWFALYDVDFAGRWTFVPERDGAVTLSFPFPVADGVYDDFRFQVDGVDVADQAHPSGGNMEYTFAVTQGREVVLTSGYRSRGLDSFAYRPMHYGSVGTLKDFALDLHTDFEDIDYPAFTLSPSERNRTDEGWHLRWDFTRLVTGHGMGMVMPQKVQPGPLAASMALSAPISLALFMMWIHVLSLLRNLDVHPMNHLFLAGAFFSFHLLFGYSADHLPVEWAFALSAVVSVALVVSYLRLVVGPRFAFVEAGLAQVVYLVGFSLAHFWEGMTGLTVTVLGILTLFALMQMTGRIDWSEVFAGKTNPAGRT